MPFCLFKCLKTSKYISHKLSVLLIFVLVSVVSSLASNIDEAGKLDQFMSKRSAIIERKFRDLEVLMMQNLY